MVTDLKRVLELELDIGKASIAIIGLGYVGLPLAVEFGKHRAVVGLDINEKRVMSCATAMTLRLKFQIKN